MPATAETTADDANAYHVSTNRIQFEFTNGDGHFLFTASLVPALEPFKVSTATAQYEKYDDENIIKKGMTNTCTYDGYIGPKDFELSFFSYAAKQRTKLVTVTGKLEPGIRFKNQAAGTGIWVKT